MLLCVGCGVGSRQLAPSESPLPSGWDLREMVEGALPALAPHSLPDSLRVDSVHVLAWKIREIRHSDQPPVRYDRAIVWVRFRHPPDHQRWALLHLHRSEADPEWTWFRSMHGPHPGSRIFRQPPTAQEVCDFIALDREWARSEERGSGPLRGPRTVVLEEDVREQTWRSVTGRLPLPGCGAPPPPDTAAWPTTVRRMPVIGYAVVQGRAQHVDGTPMGGEEVALLCPAGGDWVGGGRTNEQGEYRIRSALPMTYQNRKRLAGGEPLPCTLRLGAWLAADTVPVRFASSPDSLAVTLAPVLVGRK